MDTGSQRTYVTEEIVKQFHLSPSARESYAVFTFGSNKPNQISTPLAAFDLKLNNGRNLTITVSVVTKISEKILRSPLDNLSTKKLKGCKLADKPPLRDESSEIGILIENDHYEQCGMELFMTGIKIGNEKFDLKNFYLSLLFYHLGSKFDLIFILIFLFIISYITIYILPF